MLAEISATGLRDWESFFREEPFGYERIEQLVAAIIQTIINIVSSEPVTLQYILDNVLPHYILAEEQYDHEAAVAADVARVKALVASGAIRVNDERNRASLWGFENRSN